MKWSRADASKSCLLSGVPLGAPMSSIGNFALPIPRSALPVLPGPDVVQTSHGIFHCASARRLVADDLGCYGGKENPTPNLDALAAGGVRVTGGYVTAPFCATPVNDFRSSGRAVT